MLTKKEKFLLSIIEYISLIVAEIGRTAHQDKNEALFKLCETAILKVNAKLDEFLAM